MFRTICQRLTKLLRPLLGRGDNDQDNQAEQDADRGTGQNAGSKTDTDRNADDPDRSGGNGRGERDDRPDDVEDDSGNGPSANPDDGQDGENSQSDSKDDEDDADENNIDVDLDGMQNPCVGSDRWDHAPAMPTPPDEPDATIDATIWPEAGSDDVRAGCEMAAAHLEYVVLEANRR